LHTRPTSARHWSPALAAVCAAGFGFGLARTLFEWQPQRLAWLGQWPGSLALVAVTVVAAAALASRWPGLAAAAALPLALPTLHALAPNVDLLRGWVLVAGGVVLAAALAEREKKRDRAPAHTIFLFLCLFLLYLACLAPAVGQADTFEFQVGIARLGIAHGSGYPLLMLLGKLFSLLPLGGTLAWRANLTSAFFGACAGVLTAYLARRLGAGPYPAVLAGLVFGASPTLWSRAVEVEAYSLNATFVAALLYLALDLAATGSLRRLPLLTFLFGLSLTNHLTTVLLAPVVVGAVALTILKERESEKEAGGAARPHPSSREAILHPFLALLLGLAVYLYLPLRWPAVNGGERLSVAHFADIVTGGEAKGAFDWTLPLRDAGRYAIVFGKMRLEYGWVGVAAIVLSLVLLGLALWHHARLPPNEHCAPQLPVTNYQSLFLLFLAYLPYLYFALAFNVPDPDFSAFLIPLHLITAVLIGLALHALLLLTSRLQPLALSLVLTAFALLPLRSVWQTLPRVDKSDDWSTYRLGQQIMVLPLVQGATILADSQKIAPLYYLQVAEGKRPDLDIVVLPDEASYRVALDERIAAGRTVYLGRYLPGLGDGYALRSMGPLVEVALHGWTQAPVPLNPPAEQPSVPGLQLLGYDAASDAVLTAAAGDEVPLTLAWQAAAPLDANLLVSLQLVDAHGQVAWRGPGRVPVGGLYPTNAWRPSQVVSDYQPLLLPRALVPGTYRLQGGLFPPFAVGDIGWTEITTVTVTAPSAPARPSRPLRARFGDVWLLGYDLPEAATPGARVDLVLYVLRSASPSQSVTVLGEARSLDTWPAGSVVPLVYTRHAPEEAGSFTLDLSMATSSPARCGWLAPPSPGCRLPPVMLAGQAAVEGSRNFDHQLLLNRMTLDTPAASPGGQVRVTLEWQGLRRMADDYTVFVHLLGPDGRVHGQVDAWPVSGTQATSRWEPGQPIHDPYTVAVPADAPAGPYQVEVGLYLLATGERLPVLNEAGEVIDDRVLLPGLTISP
jgi:hypothetical protein